MRITPRFLFLIAALSGAAIAAENPATPAFTFNGVGYFHRWSEKGQHEFTPDKQEDLKKWSEMMTVNLYNDVHDGEGLATTANAVLENYKKHQAMVLRTNSVPRTADHPAEYFIGVLFPQHDFIEAAFARFKLVDGTGCSCVFSHRIYGEKIGDQMSAWLDANGRTTEKALMEWQSIPTPASLK